MSTRDQIVARLDEVLAQAEDALNSGESTPRDDLASLNNRLADAKVYNDFVRKQIGAWSDLRNNADHGHFDAYDSKDVQAMGTFARTFLGERLA